MINKDQLFKIGIGSWGLGGLVERDPNIDRQKQVDAVIHMLQQGMNFMEANLWYSDGASAEILAEALKRSGKSREDVFICQAVYLNGQTLESVESEIQRARELFETDHVDSLQFTQSVFLRFGFDKACAMMQRVLVKKLTRYTSITNEPTGLLKQYHERFGDQFFSHEVCYNFEIRENEENGVIPYATENNILTVVFQPLRRNRTAKRNWPLLVELSQKYGATQNQVIFAWILSKGFLPLTKSENTEHIDEYIAAINLKLESNDLERLNAFTPPGYSPIKIDWNKIGDGVRIDLLSNVFDEEYERQLALAH